MSLHVVASQAAPEPPYPADTRVNGWRFELDVERIKRSDTWVMAQAEWRPWLLMIWMVAWDQRPAGSLPADHALIAAHIGMEPRIFAAHADILLRGFVLHADGRLYHPVVVDQVRSLVDWREQERTRKASWRQKSDGVPRDRRGTDVGKTTQEQEQEQDSSTDVSRHQSAVATAPTRPPAPFADILALWKEILPELPQPLGVNHWTEARKTQIRARWRNELPDLDTWKCFFQDIRRSKFLMGRSPARSGHKPFQATLFWATKPENILKIAEGRYDE
jgi:hypothetical protein